MINFIKTKLISAILLHFAYIFCASEIDKIETFASSKIAKEDFDKFISVKQISDGFYLDDDNKDLDYFIQDQSILSSVFPFFKSSDDGLLLSILPKSMKFFFVPGDLHELSSKSKRNNYILFLNQQLEKNPNYLQDLPSVIDVLDIDKVIFKKSFSEQTLKWIKQKGYELDSEEYSDKNSPTIDFLLENNLLSGFYRGLEHTDNQLLKAPGLKVIARRNLENLKKARYIPRGVFLDTLRAMISICEKHFLEDFKKNSRENYILNPIKAALAKLT